MDSGSTRRGHQEHRGIRDLGADRSNTPAAVVLVSNDEGISQHDDPWEDTLAVNASYISYWGDTKEGNPYDESNQNEKIKNAFERTASGHREEVPPVLVFRKPRSGIVEFCGLYVPDHFEVRSYRDEDTGAQIPNFLFHFSILNTASYENPAPTHSTALTIVVRVSHKLTRTWPASSEPSQQSLSGGSSAVSTVCRNYRDSHRTGRKHGRTGRGPSAGALNPLY